MPLPRGSRNRGAHRSRRQPYEAPGIEEYAAATRHRLQAATRLERAARLGVLACLQIFGLRSADRRYAPHKPADRDVVRVAERYVLRQRLPLLAGPLRDDQMRLSARVIDSYQPTDAFDSARCDYQGRARPEGAKVRKVRSQLLLAGSTGVEPERITQEVNGSPDGHPRSQRRSFLRSAAIMFPHYSWSDAPAEHRTNLS